MEDYSEFIAIKSLFYFCSLPLRLDSYSGCTFGCKYCFSNKLNNRKASFHNDMKKGSPSKLRSLILRSLNTTSDKDSAVVSCLKHLVPIHFGCVSDPFPNCEADLKVTKRMLLVLKEFRYPTVICTKSSMVANKEYSDVLAEFPVSVQMSFSTLNDAIARRLEPNASSVDSRLEALKKLSSRGIYTVVRLQPYVYEVAGDDEDNIRLIASLGVKHLVLEHLRIPTNNSNRSELWSSLGMNLLEVYQTKGVKTSRVSYELAAEAKLENITRIKELTHKYGMTFGSGDNDFHHISDSNCCCGIPLGHTFNNYYKGHISSALRNHIQYGVPLLRYIEDEWHPNGSIREYVNSDCRQPSLRTIKDHIISRLTNMNLSNSPLSFYGVTQGIDGNLQISDLLKTIMEVE